MLSLILTPLWLTYTESQAGTPGAFPVRFRSNRRTLCDTVFVFVSNLSVVLEDYYHGTPNTPFHWQL